MGRVALLVVTVLVAAWSAAAAALQGRPDPPGGLIVGQVVDAASGRPVAGAIVTLAGPPPLLQGTPHSAILTGGDGRFLFRDLRPGSYRIRAHRSGFADGAYGRTRPAGPSLDLSLASGQRVGDVVIRMWRHAAISGTIVDESGEPQVAVEVRAYRRTTVGGRRQFITAATAATDDRGIYRLGGLVPGDYIVGTVSLHASLPSALARDAPGTTFELAGSLSGPIPYGPAELIGGGEGGLAPARGTPLPRQTPTGTAIYPPTYHPFGITGQRASVLSVGAGDEYESADLYIAPVPSVRITGQVFGPDGPLRRTRLRLVSGARGMDVVESDWLLAMTDDAGRFIFPTVPSGYYVLRLRHGAAPPGGRPNPLASVVWTELPLNVGNEDIANLTVVARSGLRIRGRLEFEGTRPPPALSRVQVTFEPADAAGAEEAVPVLATTDAFGNFESPGLPAGRYYVRVLNSPTGWMFRGATHAGRDVVDTPLDVSEDVSGVIVSFTDRWSGIEGSVRSGNQPDGAALVLVFPTDTDAWGSSGTAPRRVRSVRSGAGGQYALNIPPGEYYVVAVADALAGDWQDPSFMEAASRAAVRVQIGTGERRTQDLRTREVR